MKRIILFLGLIMALFAVASILQPEHLSALTATYNSTIRIVDSLGNVIGGTASGTTANYNSTVRVVDSNGNVLNGFGGVGSTGQSCTGATCTVTANSVNVNAMAQPVAANLPAATGSYNAYLICKTDSGPNAVTVTPNGTDTINNGLNFVLNRQYQCIGLVDLAAGNWSISGTDFPVTQNLPPHYFANQYSANGVISGLPLTISDVPGSTNSFPNASTTGTTLNSLVTFTGLNVVNISAGATSKAIGICDSICGQFGNASIMVGAGVHFCNFDGSVTQGDYVGISTSVAGDCTDKGASPPNGQETVGLVYSPTTSGAGVYKIYFYGPDFGGAGTGGGNNACTANPLAGSWSPSIAANSINCLTNGTYTIQSSYTIAASGVTIRGSGPGVTTITEANSANFTSLLNASSQSNLIIRDLTIDCNRANNATAGDAFKGTSMTNVLFDNVEIKNCAGNGAEGALYFTTTSNHVYVKNSKFSNDGVNGTGNGKAIKFNFSSGTSTDNRIDHNFCDDTGQGAGCIKTICVGSSTISDTMYEENNTMTSTAGASTGWFIENFGATGNSGGGQCVERNLHVINNKATYTAFNSNGNGFSQSAGTASHDWVVSGNIITNANTPIETITPREMVSNNTIVNGGASTLNANNVNTATYVNCTASTNTCTAFTDAGTCLVATTSATEDFIVGDGLSQVMIHASGPSSADDVFNITNISSNTFTLSHNISTTVSCQQMYSTLGNIQYYDNKFINSGSSAGILAVVSGSPNDTVGWDVTVHGNVFEHPNANLSVVEVRVIPNAAIQFQQLVFDGNYEYDDAGTPTGNAWVALNPCTNCTVSNNIIYNSTRTTQVFQEPSGSGNRFYGNFCYKTTGSGACTSVSQSGSYDGPEITPLMISGALGGLSSTAAATLLGACTIMSQPGHFINLVLTNDLNGSSCSTAPTYNIRDNTASTTGTAKAASTTAGVVNQTQTLAYSAGDTVCLVRTVNGGTCTVPFFQVAAQAVQGH